MESIPPKLGPYHRNQNLRQNAENRDFKKFAICNLLPTRLCRAATTKPGQIERSSFFFYWTTTIKLEFTDWSRVHSMFCCRENAILPWRRMITPPPLRRIPCISSSKKIPMYAICGFPQTFVAI